MKIILLIIITITLHSRKIMKLFIIKKYLIKIITNQGMIIEQKYPQVFPLIILILM